MPRSNKIDWITLEAEFITSDPQRFPTKTSFFREKGIPHSTWSSVEAVKSFDAKRTSYLQKTAETAMARASNKRIKFLERAMKIGESLQSIGGKALTARKGNLKPRTVGEARDLVESGFKIQTKVLELEKPSGSFANNNVNSTLITSNTFNESECIAEIESKLSRFFREDAKT